MTGGLERTWTTTVIVCLAIIATGCAGASIGARPSPFPAATGPAVVVPNASRAGRAAAASSALALRGTAYRLGGDQPSTGFDCSGLVRYVFQGQHVELPRTVIEQSRVGVEISPRDIAAGDLVFFSITTTGPSHVGIAIDGDSFVHAPGSGSVVRVERLSAPYWAERLNGIRRVPVAASPQKP